MTIDLTTLKHSAKFENRTFSSEEMKQIAQSVGLVGISFVNCPITDDAILALTQLHKLVNLTLENTHITDKALEYLSRLPNLKYLFITKATITGEGFKHFENHKKIECIWACSTKLADDNLKYLAAIPKLGILRILDTPVTFDGLLSIAYNPRIRIVAEDIFTADQMALFEQTQRNSAKKNLIVNEADVAVTKELLRSFFNAITEWEKYAGKVGFTEELSTKCKEIFDQYCVAKPRGGYRPDSLSYAGGPDYTYALHEIIDTEQPSKNKIIIYTKVNHLQTQYRFIVLKKDDEWKIDEGQWNDGGWKKYGL